MEIQRSDYSREMTQTRNRILNNLDLIDDEEIHRMGEQLYTEMGFITSSAYRERAAQSFFVDAPIAIKKKQTGAYDYKDQLDAIEKQLYAFPYSLYPTFKADPVDFLRQVFYKRVPRKMMLQLLSGIVLMIMNGRVSDVKQCVNHDKGAVAKSSGAGGGDCGIALSFDEQSTETLKLAFLRLMKRSVRVVVLVPTLVHVTSSSSVRRVLRAVEFTFSA